MFIVFLLEGYWGTKLHKYWGNPVIIVCCVEVGHFWIKGPIS